MSLCIKTQLLLHYVISGLLPGELICLKGHTCYIIHCNVGSVNLCNADLCLDAGVEGMECSLPMDGRRVSLSQLSKDSFRECQATLTLTDLLIIIFSGISVSVVAIMTSFFLASTVHCFQRWSKGTKGDEEESEEWMSGFYFSSAQIERAPQTMRGHHRLCATCDKFHAVPREYVGLLTVGS